MWYKESYRVQVVEMDYPTLELAVTLRHEDFVAHDYCQQILREEWLESNETGNRYCFSLLI